MGDRVVLARRRHGQIGLCRRHAQALGQLAAKGGGSVFQQHPVLRALGAGDAGLHGGQVEFQRVGEHRIGRGRVAPHALRLGVGFHQSDAVGVAAGQMQIRHRHLVQREEAAGGTILGGHVADRRTVGQRQVIEASTEEFDEFADHALAPQHLRDREDQIGRGGALGHFSGQAEADHVGDQHGDRLAEHRRLRLDPADAPAEDAEAIHHRCVAVGAVKRVRIGEGFASGGAGPDALAEIFQVHLMADAGAGRHHAEIIERLLAPAQEGVALAVAVELDIHVLRQAVGGAEIIHHHRVVDHEIDGDQRVHLLRLAAQAQDPIAHGREIDHAGHAGKVLHQDAGRLERHFGGRGGVGEPAGHGLRIRHAVGLAVLEAQDVLQQDLQADRQAGHVADRLFRLGDREILIAFSFDIQSATGLQTVLAERCHRSHSPSVERRLYVVRRPSAWFRTALLVLVSDGF